MNSTKLENLLRMLVLIGVISGGATVLAACNEDGPLENAGEAIDEAGEEIADEVDDAI